MSQPESQPSNEYAGVGGNMSESDRETPKLLTVEQAARALIQALDKCAPAVNAAFHLQMLHDGPYTGPTYGLELEHLRNALLRATPPLKAMKPEIYQGSKPCPVCGGTEYHCADCCSPAPLTVEQLAALIQGAFAACGGSARKMAEWLFPRLSRASVSDAEERYPRAASSSARGVTNL